jgi:opacity protein-like surface antigen
MKRFLAALAAALLVPALASAQAAASKQLSVGGFVGYETDDASGLTLRLDGEMPFQALSPKINLSFVGSIGYSRLGIDQSDFKYNLFRIIPAARFTMPVNEQLSLYGDAGLGLYHARFSYEFVDYRWVGPGPYDYALAKDKVSDSTTGFLMRFGVGGFFKVNEQLKLGAELDLIPHFGDYDQTSFNILVGAMFALK